MSFSRNFNNKAECSGKKQTDKKHLHQEVQSNSDIYKRDVFPQFSEPDEFSSTLCGASNWSQQSKKNNLDKRKSLYFKSGNRTNKMDQRHKTLSMILPTFQKYISEEFEDVEQIREEKIMQERTSSNTKNKGNTQELMGCSKNSLLKFDDSTSYKESKNENTCEVKSTKELIGTRTRYLIGTIDQVIRWYKMVKNAEFEIHYEVAGVMESKIKKDNKHLLFIRSESGHILQGLFYNIDRELPDFQHGTTITATGNMIGGNKLHIFDAAEISRDDFMSIQRLAFLSQRSLQEALYSSNLLNC